MFPCSPFPHIEWPRIGYAVPREISGPCLCRPLHPHSRTSSKHPNAEQYTVRDLLKQGTLAKLGQNTKPEMRNHSRPQSSPQRPTCAPQRPRRLKHFQTAAEWTMWMLAVIPPDVHSDRSNADGRIQSHAKYPFCVDRLARARRSARCHEASIGGLGGRDGPSFVVGIHMWRARGSARFFRVACNTARVSARVGTAIRDRVGASAWKNSSAVCVRV